jgi:predicted nucleotidyltransferase
MIIVDRSAPMTIAAGMELPEAEIGKICRRYRVKELAVFGSAARGEMRPDSDIDLLVEFLPEAKVSLLQHFAAEREFSELLGRKVDLVSKRALREALKEEVLSQARRIYEA